MASIGDIVAHLKLDISNFANNMDMAMNQIDNSAEKFGGIKRAGEALAPVGKMLTASITAPVVAFGAASIKTGMDFSAAISKVGALSGATGKDLQKLEDCAREMGATTMYSATDAADALGYMALAGWDVNESTTALPGVLNLAAASGMDLAQASDLCTDYMSAFGMEANQAGHFADVLAYAQAHSNTTTEQLGAAFQNCAVNCNNFGMDAEQTTAVLGKLADQGLKGSEAGTALNAVIRDMTTKMKDGQIQIGKTKVAVTDANGNFRDMKDIVSDVQKATDGMTEAEKLNALQSTFTADSIKAMGILVNGTEGELESFTNELYNSEGAAKAMADAMNDNLKGDLMTLKSALQDLQIELSKALEPALRNIVQAVTEATRKFTGWFKSLSDGQKKAVLGIIGFIAAIGPMLLIVSKVMTSLQGMYKGLKLIGKAFKSVGKVVKAVKSAWETFQIVMLYVKDFIMTSVIPALQSLWAFMLANPITFVIAAIIALVAAFVILWNKSEAFREFWKGVWENIKQAVSDAGDFIKENFSGIIDFFNDTWKLIQDVFRSAMNIIKAIMKGDWDTVKKIAEVAWRMIKNDLAMIWEDIKLIFQQAIEFVRNKIDEWVDGCSDRVKGVWQQIQYRLQEIWEGIKQVFDGAIQFVKGLIDGDWKQVAEGAGKVWDGVKQIISNAWELIKTVVKEAVQALKEWLVEKWEEIKQTVSEKIDALKQAAIDKFNEIKDNVIQAVTDMYNNVIQWFQQLPETIWYWLCFIVAYVVLWAGQMIQKAWETGTQFVENVIQFIKELPGKIWNFLVECYNKAVQWATQMWTKAKEAGSKFIQNVITFIQQLPGKVWNFLVSCYQRAVQWASQMGQKARQAGQQFVQNVVNFIQSLPGRVMSFLSQVVSRAISWAAQMGRAGMQAARQLVTNCVNGIKSLPGKMVSIGSSIVQGIIRGVSGAAGKLFSKMKSIASNALKAAKNALGINSPSKVFRDVVGRSIPEGIAVGVVKSEDEAIKSIDDMTADLVKSINVGALMDSVNIKPSGTIINNSNKSLASAINGLIDKVTSKEDSERTIQVNLNIDNFNNNTKEDINKIAEDLAFYMKRKRL